MAKKLDPRAVFNKAYQDRQAYPLARPGTPYKLVDARQKLKTALGTAHNALEHERYPAKWRVWSSASSGVSDTPRQWTEWMMRHQIAFVLGYEALPALEVMDRSELLASFATRVLNDILPATAAGLALPKGEPMMMCLVELLERTLLLVDETLAASEVAHA